MLYVNKKRNKNMEEFKSGFVSIIGKTNVGKSTLINSLAGEKVAIITPKTQTTRTQIRAIVNRENSQIIFIDTPGIHKPKNRLGEIMIDSAFGTMSNVDVVLFLVDATAKTIDQGNIIILNRIKELNKKTILIINKIDLIKKEKLLEIIDMYSQEYEFEDIIPISALKNENIEEILKEIEERIPVRTSIL